MKPMKTFQRSSFLASVLLFFSCAGKIAETTPSLGPEPTPVSTMETEVRPQVETPSPRQKCEMFAKSGVLRRSALVLLIDAGFPRWLQGIEGDRALMNHRFQGWVLKSMYPGDPCYQDLDLRSGDVIQKVNGKSVEKPEQALEVFQSMKKEPAIVIDYLREGKPRRLTIAIDQD
jgi:hypothetical protein